MQKSQEATVSYLRIAGIKIAKLRVGGYCAGWRESRRDEICAAVH